MKKILIAMSVVEFAVLLFCWGNLSNEGYISNDLYFLGSLLTVLTMWIAITIIGKGDQT